MKLLFLIFFPMVTAFISLLIGKYNKRARNVFAVFVGITEFIVSLFLFFSDHETAAVANICLMGLNLESDGFRRLYSVVIALMWMMTLAFSDQYFEHYRHRNRYYFFNLMTLGATMGVFLAADLFTAFVFFEIMSFTSYVWVLHEETPDALRSANTYLAVAVIGGLTALMGLFILQNKLGTTAISALYELASACPDKRALYAAGGCILFGFGAKAGMFPVHIWLPKAHPVAPAPASALLSGVLTKSGIWGVLAVSCNLFRHDPAWGCLILLLGCITMFLGAVLALFSINLKRTLACSSMSQIGFILVGIGMMGLLGEENALAARGALLHMMNHSLLKLVLFMCAGVIHMKLHQLDLNEIRGFGRKKPLLNCIFGMGLLGIGGIPLWNGYISKTLLHESIVEGAALYGAPLKIVEWVFLISGGLTLAYMTKLYVCLFIEKHPSKQAEYDKIKPMDPLSGIALTGSAVLLPLLGMTASKSMNFLADMGTDFFHSGELEHAVQFFSLENLKGALISVAIGAAVYFLIVRKLMMKGGRYVDLWPKKLDLEELLYRPLILKWLPGILGRFSELFALNRITSRLSVWLLKAAGHLSGLFADNKITSRLSGIVLKVGAFLSGLFADNRITAGISRAVLRAAGILSRMFSDSLDAFVFLLRRTVLCSREPPDEDKVTSSFIYRAGDKMDSIAVRRGKEPVGGHRFSHYFYRFRNTVRNTSRRITGNLSFALLMLCAAVCFILIYLLIIHT